MAEVSASMLILFHGGRLISNSTCNSLEYVGGKQEEIIVVNSALTYEYVCDLRRSTNNMKVNKMFYKGPNSGLEDLVPIVDHECNYGMFQVCEMYGLIEIYFVTDNYVAKEPLNTVLASSIKLYSKDLVASTSRQNVSRCVNGEDDEDEIATNASDMDDELHAARETLKRFEDVLVDSDDDPEFVSELRDVVDNNKDQDRNKATDLRDVIQENAQNDYDSSYVGDSEYFDSSDAGSYGDSSIEDNEEKDSAIRKKSIVPVFKASESVPNFDVSMVFKDGNELKEAINLYSILTRRNIRFLKNEPGRVRAKCNGTECDWLVYESSTIRDDSFQIKTYRKNHSNKCEKLRNMRKLTATFLAKKYRDVIVSHPTIKASYLRTMIGRELGLITSVSQCTRTKYHVWKELIGTYKDEFDRLYDYTEELLKSNPGTTVKIKSDRVTLDCKRLFQRYYVCLDSCKRGLLEGCRRVLGLDGGFLKGMVKGELLAAVGRDANNQMFPVAWAMVELENYDSWEWFLECLRMDINTSGGEGWTLITDQQKGLISAIQKSMPHAEHRYCVRHIYAN